MKIPLVDLTANYLSQKKEIDVAIANVIGKSAFIGGDILKRFETNYAEWCEVKHAIGCANGTSALHLALLALGLSNGAEVITVPNTFIATTEAISHAGGKIKFVDVKPDTALMDIDLLEKAISPRTKAILVVHLFGQMPDMERLRDIADDKGLFLIEDAAQAHGAQWLGHQPGYYGDIATYSFFPAKILGCFGEGGCVTTNNDTYAERINLLKDHGRTAKYEHFVEGYAYRLDTLQAAILNAKLPKLRTKITKRQLNALYYDNYIDDKIREGAGSSATYYMYVMRTQNRQEFIEHMRKKGIGTGIHYPIPLHLQHAYKGLKKGDMPVAEMLAKEIVSIPVYPELKPEQLNYIVRAVNDF
jgi:dTDP-4-amino-4,6-dideoxygalactose transaminase